MRDSSRYHLSYFHDGLVVHDKSVLYLTMVPHPIPEGTTMANLTGVLQQLREEHKRAQTHVEKLDRAISVIESLNSSGESRTTKRPTRIISASSRRKMALAQKARWRKVRKGSQPATAAAKTTGSARVKRTLSASARSKIAAAQRTRWAKWKKANRK